MTGVVAAHGGAGATQTAVSHGGPVRVVHLARYQLDVADRAVRVSSHVPESRPGRP